MSPYLKRGDISNAIYVEKAFAMYSVVIAHLHFFEPLSVVMGVVGTMGVPTFPILAGYLSKSEDSVFRGLLPKLTKRILVPWFFLSTITYIIHIVADKQPFVFWDCVAWDLGYMTWMYSVPVYLISRLVGGGYYGIKSSGLRQIYFVVVISMSCASKILTQYGVWGVTMWITPYQNPLNFVVYYMIGILFRKRFDWNIPQIKVPYLAPSIVICGLSVVIRMSIATEHWLIVPIKILMQISVAVVFFYISVLFLTWNKSKVIKHGLQYIGKRTYLLFFFHMQLGVSLFHVIMSKLSLPSAILNAMTVLAPIPIICALSFLIWCLDRLIIKMKLERYAWVVGL